MSQKLVGPLTMVTLLVSGCTDGKPTLMAVSDTSVPRAEGRAADAELSREGVGRVAGNGFVQAEMRQTPPQPGPDRNSPPIPGERKLIRKGEMTLTVPSIAAALDGVAQIMISVGGQTANQLERQNEYGGRTASITCRVPADRLDAAIEAVRALGQSRALTFTAEDVTADYFDVTVRINTQKALERQLVVLLQRASNRLSDLLEIERELAECGKRSIAWKVECDCGTTRARCRRW